MRPLRLSLRTKLAGSFSLLVLLTAGAIIVSIGLITAGRYRTLVRDTDLVRAQTIAPRLAEYFEYRGSWEGIDELIRPLGAPDSMWGMMRGRPPRPGSPPMMLDMMRAAVRLLLVAPDGTVLADSARELSGGFVPGRSAPEGVPIRADGRIVGFLYAGTMIDPVLSRGDRRFLQAVQLAVLGAAAAASVLAAFAGLLLVRQITSPVAALSEASGRIAAGDLDARVAEGGGDELGQLGSRFNRMAEALKEARVRQRRFVSDAAHELRTPVSLIQGTLEMMMEGIYRPDPQRLSFLHEEAKKLGRMVEELQLLSNSDSGNLALSIEELDPAETVRRVVELFRVRAREKSIRLETECRTAGLRIRADRVKLEQVLGNLIANAIAHTPERGGVAVSVASAAGGSPLFSVSDTGPGIPESERERVFDRFYRIDRDRSRETGGSGLGLAISREIVLAHGGRIWVDPDYRDGARFRFTLSR